MRIEQRVVMELYRISIQDRSYVNNKGKFLCFDFNMIYPSSGSFFEQPTNYHEGEYVSVWGNSPNVTLHQKAGRSLFKSKCEDLIKNDLQYNAQELGNPKWNIESYSLGISDYSSPLNDREWSLFYKASYRSTKDRNLIYNKDGRIVMNKNFMANIIAELPDQITGKYIKN